MRIRSRFLHLFVAHYARVAGDARELLDTFDLAADATTARDLEVPIETVHALPDWVAARVGDPEVGLHVAEQAPPRLTPIEYPEEVVCVTADGVAREEHNQTAPNEAGLRPSYFFTTPPRVPPPQLASPLHEPHVDAPHTVSPASSIGLGSLVAAGTGDAGSAVASNTGPTGAGSLPKTSLGSAEPAQPPSSVTTPASTARTMRLLSSSMRVGHRHRKRVPRWSSRQGSLPFTCLTPE